MRGKEWIHPGLPQAIFAVARAHALDAEALAASAGLDLALLGHEDPTHLRARMPALWKVLVDALPGAAVGLEVAEQLELAHLGLVGTLMQHSTTVADAVRRSLEAQRLLSSSPIWAAHWHPTGDLTMEARVEPWQAKLRHPVEALVLGGLCSARAIARAPFAPTHLQVRHARPPWSVEVERWAGTKIQWGAETNSATLPSEVLQRPIPFADAQVSEVLQSHAARVLAARDSAADPARFAEAVRSALRDLEGPDAQKVARQLGVSRRSLQRQLQKEGTSFGELLQSARREAAVALLKDPGLTLEEIATRLGFSEGSAFHRAFRRWTGETPGDWRKRSTAEAPAVIEHRPGSGQVPSRTSSTEAARATGRRRRLCP